MKSSDVINYLEESFKTFSAKDPSRNGLQVSAPEEIEKIAYAVDACMATFQKAKEVGADLLIVHHGLFWRNVEMVVDQHYSRLKYLIENNLGLYAMHLPLDAHPEIGNNRQLADIFGLENRMTFAGEYGVDIGIIGNVEGAVSLDDFANKINKDLETECIVMPFGSENVSRIGVVSGGGGDFLAEAAAAGCDTFITGEAEHVMYHTALEKEMNVIAAGHYATETVGVKSLMEVVKVDLGIEGVFVDVPTGL